MEKAWIKNKDVLATSTSRKLVLEASEAGFSAIDTDAVVRKSVRLDGQKLIIKDQEFDLTTIEHVYVIGFGKASCQAASTLSEILGSLIKAGVVIGLEAVACEFIETY